jgi:hypothetical protein
MGQNNPYRSSSDDYSNKKHPKTRAEGKSGGKAGAGQSGEEGLGTEKKTDDERFGSQKASGTERIQNRGKKSTEKDEYWMRHRLNRPN